MHPTERGREGARLIVAGGIESGFLPLDIVIYVFFFNFGNFNICMYFIYIYIYVYFGNNFCTYVKYLSISKRWIGESVP